MSEVYRKSPVLGPPLKVPSRATPVRGDVVPELKAEVSAQARADLKLLQDSVRDVFSSQKLGVTGALITQLPPSLKALLAPPSNGTVAATPRSAVDPSHVEATVENIARILQDGAVGESELAAVARTSRRIKDVLALKDHVAMLPPQVRERVETLLLGPLARLKTALDDANGSVVIGIGNRDAAALRERLHEPRPRLAHFDVFSAHASADPPSFAAPEHFAIGDLLLVPRKDGPPTLGVVVGHDPDGLRVEVEGPAGFGLKKLTPMQVAEHNPFRMGDVFHAEGKDMHVLGAHADGTLIILPYDPAHPDHVVVSRGGSFAKELAARLFAARAAAASFDPASAVTTDPAHYARTGDTVVGAYLQNGIEASALFSKRFASPGTPLTGASLQALCAEMHKVACVGADGDRPYVSGRYSTDAVHPGEVRTAEGMQSSRARAAQYADTIVGLLELPPLKDGPLDVRGMSSADERPYNFVNGMHFYPSGAGLPAYFEAAAALLEPLRRTPPVPPGGTPSDGAIDMIADAYHVLVNARPFDQVNNSMFMGQVNVLLQRAGHPAVAHGWIDHLAHRLPADSFRAVFRAHLAGTLPTPAEVGIEKF